MLDSVTKKRIDDLRNILVGKVPDPKSQVEQITTGLIYKFMYDMDVEAVEMGGVPSFFVDDYEQYSWKNLFNPKLSGVDKVKLYGDAVENMYTNPSAPQLFRDIFKNSFLPFKDPSTLNMFLKEINEFHYSHSEMLGDAFEYLLSFMGSQGDAGQFRTPRHIIDFIVEIVNPQKNETILDPACGTAGFLISAYKHILKENTGKTLGDKLTAAQRKKVGDNLAGYDISPDMTRIALVNMYLHNFASPQIHEYDCLSSEDRWSEYYDVILANPPFFSPTGGIQPHSRFGVQSKRAEVLFVDYIMEHLKPKGRAGIIVPEGIIFQTGSAYKTLRKKLIEDCLVGVISLPAGVFNPYSGVKTSILILDKQMNQKSDTIFFAKVENDGFSLGAKRTPIDKNELPGLLKIIGDRNEERENFNLVNKEEVLSENNVSLTVSMYAETPITNSDFELVPIVDTFDVLSPPIKIKSKEFLECGQFPIIDQSSNHIAGYWNEPTDRMIISTPVVIFGDHTKVVKFIDFDFVAGADGIKILAPKDNILPKFLFYIMQSLELPDLGYSRHYKELKIKEIPLPPIEVQQEIVEELEGYQKIIDGCRQVVENYKPTIDIDPSWEMVELGEICKVGSSKRIFKKEYVNDGIPFYRTKEIVELEKGNSISLELFISRKRYQEIKTKFPVPRQGDILISAVGTIGVTWVVDTDEEFYFKDGNLTWLRDLDEKFTPLFIKHTFDSLFLKQREGLIHGAAYNALTINTLSKFKIPNIDPELQVEFVKQITDEQSVIDGNKKLIESYTQKIQDRISKVWGEKSV